MKLSIFIVLLICSSALGALTRRSLTASNGNPRRSWTNSESGSITNPIDCSVGDRSCNYVDSTNDSDEESFFTGSGYYEGRTSTGHCSSQSSRNPISGCGGSSNNAAGSLLNLQHDLTVLRGPYGVHVSTATPANDNGSGFSCWRLSTTVACGTGVTSKNGQDETEPCPRVDRYYPGWECATAGGGCDPSEKREASRWRATQGGLTEFYEVGSVDGTLYVLGGTEAYEMTVSVGEYIGSSYCYAKSLAVLAVWESDPSQSMSGTGSGAGATGMVTNASAALGNAFGLSGGFASLNDFIGSVMGSAGGSAFDYDGVNGGDSFEGMNDIHITEFVGGKAGYFVSLSSFAAREASLASSAYNKEGADLRQSRYYAPRNCASWSSGLTTINGNCRSYCALSYGRQDRWGCIGDGHCRLSWGACYNNYGCYQVCEATECASTPICAQARWSEVKPTDVTVGSYVNGNRVVVKIIENANTCANPGGSTVDAMVRNCRGASGCEWDLSNLKCRKNLYQAFTYTLGSIANGSSFSDSSNIENAESALSESDVSFRGIRSLQTDQCICYRQQCETLCEGGWDYTVSNNGLSRNRSCSGGSSSNTLNKIRRCTSWASSNERNTWRQDNAAHNLSYQSAYSMRKDANTAISNYAWLDAETAAGNWFRRSLNFGMEMEGMAGMGGGSGSSMVMRDFNDVSGELGGGGEVTSDMEQYIGEELFGYASSSGGDEFSNHMDFARKMAEQAASVKNSDGSAIGEAELKQTLIDISLGKVTSYQSCDANGCYEVSGTMITRPDTILLVARSGSPCNTAYIAWKNALGFNTQGAPIGTGSGSAVITAGYTGSVSWDCDCGSWGSWRTCSVFASSGYRGRIYNNIHGASVTNPRCSSYSTGKKSGFKGGKYRRWVQERTWYRSCNWFNGKTCTSTKDVSYVAASDNTADVYQAAASAFAGGQLAYLQIIGDESGINQPHFPEYAYLTGSGGFGDIFTDAGYAMHDCPGGNSGTGDGNACHHPNDFYQDLAVGRFSTANGGLCANLQTSIEAECRNGGGASGASSKYVSETSGISDHQAVSSALASTQNVRGHHAENDGNVGATFRGAYQFFLGHGSEDQLDNPFIDKNDILSRGSGNPVMFAGACFTGGVVCPFNDVCPNNQVLGEWAITDAGYAAWYGSTGSAPWDPVTTQILALGELIGEATGGRSITGTSAGSKTLGTAIAAAAATVVDAHGCSGGQCSFDGGGGMAALQFILIGDAAMFISTRGKHGHFQGHLNPSPGGLQIDIHSDNQDSRLTCSLTVGKGDSTVCITNTGKGSQRCTFRGSDNFLGMYFGNQGVTCHSNEHAPRTFTGMGGYGFDCGRVNIY